MAENIAATMIPTDSGRELLQEIFGGGGSKASIDFIEGTLTALTAKDLEGLEFIREGAFYGLETLETIEFPDTVEEIDMYAFSGLYNIVSITFTSKNPPRANSDAFADFSTECIIYVPNESLDDYRNAENWGSVYGQIQPINQIDPDPDDGGDDEGGGGDVIS